MLGEELHLYRQQRRTNAEIEAINSRLKAEQSKLGSDLAHVETSYTGNDEEGQSCPSTSKFVTATIGGEVLFSMGSGGE